MGVCTSAHFWQLRVKGLCYGRPNSHQMETVERYRACRSDQWETGWATNTCCYGVYTWGPQGCEAFCTTIPFLWLHHMWDSREALSFGEGAEVVCTCLDDSMPAIFPSYVSTLWLGMRGVATTYYSSWGCCATCGSLGWHLGLSALILQDFPSLCHSTKGRIAATWSCTITAH